MNRFLAFVPFLAAVAALLLQQPALVSSETNVPVKEFIGVNAVVNNNPGDLATVVGWVRDYHKWYWYEATRDVYTWSSSWQRLDSFYAALKSLGVKVMPDVEFAPSWASSNGQMDGIPDPAQHAQYVGELARHYGDTIAAIENYNEPNQWWQPVRFPASQFGAMTGSDYNAAKSANPSLLLVMAGMAGPDTGYLDQAHQASGGKYDVVNFHWYAEGDTSNGGKNPESGGLVEAIDRMKAWRDSKAPGKPIWITEFGWDTYAQPDGRKSKIYAPEASAANYLLRALFLMQGRGVEKGFIYIYRDVSDNLAYLHNQYLSAGLVSNSGEKDGRKKPAWYYLATVKGILGDYVFERAVANGPTLYHYEYVLPGTNKRAAVLWVRNGDRDNGYRASYMGPAGTLVQPVDGSTTGISSPTDGWLTLTERPVFVLYSTASQPFPTATPTVVPASAPAVIPTPTPLSSGGVPLLPTTTPAPAFTPTAAAPAPSPTAVKPMPMPSGQRLLNGGFESGMANWYFPSWFGGIVSTSGTVVHSGGAALRFQGRARGPYVYQEVAASPGQRAQLSGWVNIPQRNGDMTMLVELVARHQNNGDLQTFRIASMSSTTSGWVRVSGSAVLPDRTVAVRLQIRFPGLDGAAYVDDLSLTLSGS